MVMRRRHIVLLAAAGTLGSCVPGVARRPSSTPPVAVPVSGMPNTRGPWRLGAVSTQQRVTIATHALVVITGDPGARTDTLQAVLGASYVWTAGGQRRVDGLLSDYRVGQGAALPTVPTGLQLARPFTAASATPGGSLSFRLPAESSACTDPALSALQGLQDAWIPLPDTLVAGREWSDTVHTLSCRDRVPLRGVSLRRFQARHGEVDEGGRLLVMIDRTVRTRLSGEGDQFGEHVSIDGQATGTLRYAVDPVTGRLVRGTGTSVLAFTLKSSRRNQSARQESQVTLTWSP